ncbi:acetyl esterase [Microvirga lupini]|uniref:Acetyl esterase n=1 Tax=Microvirga lupini TaxID=420324 RepID=A0A7W4VPR6_9HYPH|nr:alpha/beta hydrolase [Microvirga lupini]MBB3021089.1 acetyl esterase [Microvirga lupini]
MKLDPSIARMLEEGRAARTVPVNEIPVDVMRAGYSQKYFERSLEPSGGVHAETMTLPEGNGRFSISIYRPNDGLKPLPALLYFHGGGFVLGDTQAYSRQSMNIARHCKAAVIFVDFRRAPEHPFPAALDDALLAARWTLENAASLGLDPKRISLMGDSAGGNLAINVALHFGASRQPFHFLCLLYPVTDFRHYLDRSPGFPSDHAFGTGFGLDHALMKLFGEKYLADPALAEDPRVSPLLATRVSDLPKTAIFTAENDILRDQGNAFAERLERDGVPVAYRCMPSLIHNFMGHAAVSQAAEGAFWEVCETVKQNVM